MTNFNRKLTSTSKKQTMNDSINPSTPSEDPKKPVVKESKGRAQLRQWLNKNLRVKMTDGRVLYGVFACTDRDGNIILGSCSEYLSADSDPNEERVLGLIMVPGRHIVSIQVDDTNYPQKKMPYIDNLNKMMTDSTPEE